MATSQNGWRAGSREDLGIQTFTVPGTAVRIPLMPGPAATVLLYLLARFDKEVEDLDTRETSGYRPEDGSTVPDDWGYAERNIRGSETTLSNHASGTAADTNATQHPLGVRGTFTPAQVTAIRRILADLDGVVRWGGDYVNRADEMHFEINAGYDAVKRVADRITNGVVLGSRIPNTSPAPERFLMALTDAEQTELLQRVRGLTDPAGIRDAVWGGPNDAAGGQPHWAVLAAAMRAAQADPWAELLEHGGVSAPAKVVLVDALRAAQAAAANSLTAASNGAEVDVDALAARIREGLGSDVAAELARRLAA